MKTFVPFLAFLAFLTGCATRHPTTSPAGLPPAFYQIGTATAVSVGLRNSPHTASYLRALQPVLCAIATATNLAPDEINRILNIGNVPGASPEATAIVNGALLLYIAAYSQAGGDTNSDAARPYAQAIWCDGFAGGLLAAPKSQVDAIRARMRAYTPQWPLLEFP